MESKYISLNKIEINYILDGIILNYCQTHKHSIDIKKLVDAYNIITENINPRKVFVDTIIDKIKNINVVDIDEDDYQIDDNDGLISIRSALLGLIMGTRYYGLCTYEYSSKLFDVFDIFNSYLKFIFKDNLDILNKCIEYKFNSHSKCLHITNVIPILKQIINIKYQFNYSPLNYKKNLYLTDFYEKDFMRYIEIHNSILKPNISIEYYLKETYDKLLGQQQNVNKNKDFKDEKDDEKDDEFDIRILSNSKGKYVLEPHEDYPESETEDKAKTEEKAKKTKKASKGVFIEPRFCIDDPDVDPDDDFNKDKMYKTPKPIIFYPFGDKKNIKTK